MVYDMLILTNFDEDHNLKKRYFHAILAAIQLRMLHVLDYKTDSVTVILFGCEIWCLIQENKDLGFLRA